MSHPTPSTPSTPTTRETLAPNVRTASGLNILAGLWLIIAPFVLGYYELKTPMWNDIAVGILVVALAATRLSKPVTTTWASWLNLVLGIWLVLAPFVLQYSDVTTPLWNDVVVGVIVAALALWSGVAATSRHAHA